METQLILRSKLRQLAAMGHSGGLTSVLRHIEIAEHHFERARSDKDDELFTDVIYRTNHAFEGILKEAYSVLTDKPAERKSPQEIERYLLDNSLFHSRVMDLFTNYRVQWRNPSTHDYQLIFTEQEAFLALLSVSAFISILLDQIVESLAHKIEAQSVELRADEIRKGIEDVKGDLAKTVSKLLLSFTKDLAGRQLVAGDMPKESYVLGSLTGFLQSVAPSIQVTVEPSLIYEGQQLRPDIILASNNQRLILEIKNSLVIPGHSPKLEHSMAVQQLQRYMTASGIRQGVLYIFPLSFLATNMELRQIQFSDGTSITVISPDMFLKGLATDDK